MSILTKISNEINKLNENIENIKTAIENKGVASQGKLKNFPREIMSISSSQLPNGYIQNSSLVCKGNTTTLQNGEVLVLSDIISIPDNIENIDNYVFYSSKISEISAKNVKKIGAAAFYYCENLKKIDLPKVQTILSSGFYNCVKLKKVDLPELKRLETSTFNYCRGLIYISLKNCTEVSYSAVSNTEKLEVLEIPACTKFYEKSFDRIGTYYTSGINVFKYLIVKDDLSSTIIRTFKNNLPSGCKIINVSLTKEFNRNSEIWENLTNADTVRSEIEDIKRRAEV